MTNLNKGILLLLLSACIVSGQSCKGTQVYDEASKKCLTSKFDCTQLVSNDNTKCTAACDEFQKIYEYKPNLSQSFRQCYNCTDPTQYSSINSLNLQKKCVSFCETYQIKDDKNKLCQPCDKTQIMDENGQITCGDCQNGQYLQPELNQDYFRCVPSCEENFVLVENTSRCIPKEDCSTYIESNKCLSSCPSNYFEIADILGKPYKQCVQMCQGFSLTKDNKKLCYVNGRCPDGLIGRVGTGECILKSQCQGYLSVDGLKCDMGCSGQFVYPVKISETTYQCTVCNKLFVQGKQGDCVDTCPSGMIPYNLKVCIPSSDCTRLSSDNTQCVGDCPYPELLINNRCVNTCLGKGSDCVPSCPQGYYLISLRYGSECQKSCDYLISSDQKMCVNDCYQIFELQPDRQGQQNLCRGCKESEYYQISMRSGPQCVDLYSLSLNDIVSTISQKLMNIQTQQQFNLIKQEIALVFGQVLKSKDSSYISEGLKQAVPLIKQLVSTLYERVPYGDYAIEIESNGIGLKTRAEINRRQYVVKRDFVLKEFLSGSNSDLSVPQAEGITGTNFFNSVIGISVNNPFCSNCSYSSTLFYLVSDYNKNNEMRMLSDIVNPYTIQIPIDPSVKNIDQLVCVSYDLTGQMSGSLASTKISDDKLSVTCSFSQNVALYLDTTCLFTDKTKCKSTDNNNSNNGNNNGNNGSNAQDASNSNHLQFFAILSILLLFNL